MFGCFVGVIAPADIAKGGEPANSHFDYSGPFSEVVLLGNLAIRAGRKLYWDGPNMNVTNEPDANQWVTKTYREGWELSL